MADIFSKEDRSEIMAKISGKETTLEILVRKYLFFNGFRYRKNVKKLAGTPDIVLKKYNTVIFINGCFWHGHSSCSRSSLPKTNIDFWNEKIKGNIERDKKTNDSLQKDGWDVIIIWQCELQNKSSRESTLNELKDKITRKTAYNTK